jgi:hypothetical protein
LSRRRVEPDTEQAAVAGTGCCQFFEEAGHGDGILSGWRANDGFRWAVFAGQWLLYT